MRFSQGSRILIAYLFNDIVLQRRLAYIFQRDERGGGREEKPPFLKSESRRYIIITRVSKIFSLAIRRFPRYITITHFPEKNPHYPEM